MYYTRGSSDDYNRFAAVTGDAGWSWENMLPYMLKVSASILVSFNLLNDWIYYRAKNGALLRICTIPAINLILRYTASMGWCSPVYLDSHSPAMTWSWLLQNSSQTTFHIYWTWTLDARWDWVSELYSSNYILTKEIFAQGWYQGTIGNGTRSSSATAYLAENFTARKNLHLVLNTKVNRIHAISEGVPIFNSVEISGEHPSL